MKAMDSSPTELYLPLSFSYPIKVVSIDTPSHSPVQRGTRLLSYSFVHIPNTPDPKPETRFGTWDSAIEGTVSAWKVNAGDVISHKKARERPVVVVIEPCKHGMQVSGMCVLCGKDMTNVDYTGFSDASRASIQMTHSAFGPTVSLEEAQRIERETAEHLLKSRKLSLIVDLDQTIVHATVDPTVGEWIAEGEAWEARQAAKASDQEDECNPNWEALKDVKMFRLGPESFGPPSMRGAHKGKGKNKQVENEGCMYYIKPRPGWKEFLRQTATKYEMHVYTMGTRAYAEEVCAAIDPDASIFGGRVLSRDESGSLTQKSLQRLFPCDTSMVVIIDDRADVWEWSPNLIKVIPYDFFVGIGDINSTFLPKVEPLTPTIPDQPPPAKAPPPTNNGVNPLDKPTAVDTSPTTPPNPGDVDIAEQQTTALLTRNNAALDAQLEERPLAKKQEELLEHEIQHAPVTAAPNVKEPSPKPESLPKKALLKNDDYELDRIGKCLDEVHSRFFSVYAAHAAEKTKNSKKRKTAPLNKACDVTRIIPQLRSEVFEGVHILFSSVIPLDTRPESTEIWRMALMFGARCSTELKADITHVVAAKRGTVKVDMARKRGGVYIVWLAWFTDSIALWHRQDEKPYLLSDPPPSVAGPSSSPPTDAQQLPSSSDIDLDIDSDEWDDREPQMREPGALELGGIDWDEVNDEVDAAMNESDDEDEGEGGGRSNRGGSEDEGTDAGSVTGSVNDTLRLKRKRLRSVTPSDGGGSTSANGKDDKDEEYLRSPLAKRKKLAADRTGYSRLKEGITADDLVSSSAASAAAAAVSAVSASASPAAEEKKGQEDTTTSDGGRGSRNGTPRGSPRRALGEMDEGDDEDDEEGEEEEDDEDDFLARELEEEWG